MALTQNERGELRDESGNLVGMAAGFTDAQATDTPETSSEPAAEIVVKETPKPTRTRGK